MGSTPPFVINISEGWLYCINVNLPDVVQAIEYSKSSVVNDVFDSIFADLI